MPEGVITALRAQLNDPQRVNVFINDEFALGVSLTTISRERLYVGLYLDEAAYARVAQAEDIDRAVHAALRALESRPRSIAEIQDRLRRKGFAAEAIAAAIDRLQANGLLDDAAFARFWVENRQAYRPRGRQALLNELRRKGVAADIVDGALNNGLADDESASAEALARGVARRYAAAPDFQTFLRRLGGYLQRRGFGFDTIRPIAERLWAEYGGDAVND